MRESTSNKDVQRAGPAAAQDDQGLPVGVHDPDRPQPEFNFFVSLEIQAEWITSAFRIARSLESVVALGWVHLYDERPNPPHAVAVAGLITHDGQLKPGYAAFQEGG